MQILLPLMKKTLDTPLILYNVSNRGFTNKIEVKKELHFPHSLGLLYSSFTYFLGFKVNSGEYKLMGLAPYGNPDSEEVTTYVKLIKEELIDIKEDGSIWLNQAYFNYATGLYMINIDRLFRSVGGRTGVRPLPNATL